MDADKLKIILDKHEAWLRDSGGERANLSGANLSGAYLSVANLSGADLRYAILMYANLCGANLSNADLSDANLRYANLSGAKGILSIGPGGSRGDMLYAIQHETCVMIKGGCFWGTLEEFAAAVDKTHGNNKHGRYYRAVIEMVKAWEKGQRDVPQISKGS